MTFWSEMSRATATHPQLTTNISQNVMKEKERKGELMDFSVLKVVNSETISPKGVCKYYISTLGGGGV